MRILLLCIAGFGLGACKAPDFGDYYYGMGERRRGVPPEEVWNKNGVWYRVADKPPTYLPVGYSKHAPRSDKHGLWVVDEREGAGKKIFVPHAGANGFSAGVLKGEATKVCNWEPREVEWVDVEWGGMMGPP